MLKTLLLCIVFAIVIVFVFITFGLLMMDATEEHDYEVSKRWAARRESEPPEWADPVKWWESEGK